MEAPPDVGRIEALLAESSWVRGLAARLCGGAAEAEDLVQDTWVAALRRPPADDRPLRPWLATVVRNARRYAGRGDAARRRRERAVAPPESTVDAPDEWLERLELQELLSRLVRSLPDAEREVCLLRFYEGLDSAEIGRRIGAPAGTVRWRLKQALDRLREELDDRFGDRRAWVAVLAPLGRLRVAATVGAASSLPLLPGILAMPFFAKLGLAAALVTLLLLWPLRSLLDSAETPPAPASRAAPEVAAADPAPEPAELAAPPPVAPDVAPQRAPAVADVPQPAAARPLTRATLRVVDGAGRPVAGAEVRAEPGLDVARASQSLIEALGPLEQMRELAGLEATTDADGRAELSTRLLVETGSATLRAVGPAFGTWEQELVLEPGETLELGDVALAPGGAVEARVVDRAGAGLVAWTGLVPVADADGAEPEAPGAAARPARWDDDLAGRTDADGALRLVGVPAGRYRLWAQPDGVTRWHRSAPFEASHGVLVAAELTVDVAGVVKPFVRVLDPEGAPVAGARVAVALEGGGVTTNADAEGVVDLARFGSPLRDVRVVAADAEQRWGPVEERWDEHPGEIEVRLRAVPTTVRALRVVGRDAEPVPAFHLHVAALGAQRWVSAEDGAPLELRLPAAPGERFDVQVRAEGFQLRTLEGLALTELPEPWVVRLDALPGIRGRVTLAGEPVANARLRVSHRTEPGHVELWRDAVCTVRWIAGQDFEAAADGTFDVGLKDDGDWVMRVSAPGAADAIVDLAGYDPAVGIVGLEVELVEPGTIEGRAVDAAGAPLARTLVVASHPEHAGRRARTDRDGRYRLRRVPPGDWNVRAVTEPTEGGWTQEVEVAPEWTFPTTCRVHAGETTALDLALPGPAELRGRLTTSGGALEGLELLAVPDDARDPFAGLTGATCSIAPDGSYRVVAARPGAWRLVLSAPRLAGRIEREVELSEAAQEADLHLALATLEGVVEGWSATPGENVRVRGGGDGWTLRPARLALDAERGFGPVHVPAGDLRLEHVVDSADPASVRSVDVTLRPGDVETVRVP